MRNAHRLLVLLLFAATTNGQKLTVDFISQGPHLAGYHPEHVRWAPDGKHVYFDWKQYDEPVEKDFDTYVVDRDGEVSPPQHEGRPGPRRNRSAADLRVTKRLAKHPATADLVPVRDAMKHTLGTKRPRPQTQPTPDTPPATPEPPANGS